LQGLDKSAVAWFFICLNAKGMPVQLFERNTIFHAFRLPLWGRPADETPPQWFVHRLQSGDFGINSLGGVTIRNRWGTQSCAAGDIVLLTNEDTIEFITPEEFDKLEPISADRLLRAA
jgi:hypothetical protein